MGGGHLSKNTNLLPQYAIASLLSLPRGPKLPGPLDRAMPKEVCH